MVAGVTSIGGKFWLAGDAAASYLRMVADSGNLTGLAAAGRTREQQAALYDAYLHHGGNLAAKPGHSLHESGLAIDVTRKSTLQVWMVAGGSTMGVHSGEKIRAQEYGWFRTVPSEAWHFRYYRAKDKHRAAALAARIAELGYTDVKAFQKAHGLVPDGVDGPLTWHALVTATTPAPTPDPTPTPATVLALRVATFNTMDPALTGSKPLTASRAAALGKTAAKAKADVYLLNECPEAIRDVLRAAMPGGASRWLVRPRGAQAIMWDSDRLTETAETAVDFKGISYQGGQICVLKDKSTGQQVVFGSYHLTPNSRSTDAQQRSQMSQMIAAIRKYGQGPRILGGDGVNDNAWLPGWDDAREKAANSSTRDAKTYQGKAITDRIHSDHLNPVDWRGYNVKPSSGSDHALVITAVNIPIQTNSTL